MFDEMKAQVKIIPLSVTRLAVSQSARQSLSICCHHSTLGTDCVSYPEFRACSSGDSLFIIEVSAPGRWWDGGGVFFLLSLVRALRSYVCSPRSHGKACGTGRQRPLAKGKWKLRLKGRIICATALGKFQKIWAVVWGTFSFSLFSWFG